MTGEGLRDETEQVLTDGHENGRGSKVPELFRFDSELDEKVFYSVDLRYIFNVAAEVSGCCDMFRGEKKWLF